MSTLNAYATLADYKNYVVARAQTPSTSTGDDTIIEDLLRAASRFIDRYTGRRFYPSIETVYLDVPVDQNDLRQLSLGEDFLEILSVVNGDDSTIPSTEYTMLPRGKYPALYLRLKDNSTYSWVSDGAGDTHGVIEVTGIIGYHNRYGIAWLNSSTLNEALDDSETGIDVASGTPFAAGNIIRIEDELCYVSAVVTNTLTATRGENTSTAATHVTSTAVKVWQVVEDVKEATLMIAHEMYRSRSGKGGEVATLTPAGVVITPNNIPARLVVGLSGLKRLV